MTFTFNVFSPSFLPGTLLPLLFFSFPIVALNILAVQRRQAIQANLSSMYVSTLKRLFKATFKAPSRHSDSVQLSSLELFQARKTFFQNHATIRSKPQIIHVAGTKGKGSTVELIAAGLRSHSSKVGIFTSPHLHTARERIKIGTQLISQNDITRLGKEVLDCMSDIPWVVFFDMFLLLAMRYFDEQAVKYVVLEAGIGGRYDSTNYIDTPAAAVITSISLDHQALLGDTIEQIAWQKAGIIKPHGHVFTSAAQDPIALEIIRQHCNDLHAYLHVVPVHPIDINAAASTDGTAVGASTSAATATAQSKSTPTESTPTTVQMQNVCLAKAVLDHLQVDSSGMRSFYWPCRMEMFQVPVDYTDSNNNNNNNDEGHAELRRQQQLLYGSPSLLSTPSLSSSSSSSSSSPSSSSSYQPTTTVILDGCHNEHSVQLFCRDLRVRYPRSTHTLLILFGAGMEKYLGNMLMHIFTQAEHVLFIQSRHFKSLSEVDLFNAAYTSLPRELLRNHLINYSEPTAAVPPPPLSSPPSSSSSSSSSGQKDKIQNNVHPPNPQPPSQDSKGISAALVEGIGGIGPSCSSCGPSTYTPRARKPEGTVSDRLHWAINHADLESQMKGKPVVIAVCGSLFACSDAREALYHRCPALFREDDWVREADPSLDI